MNSHTVRNFYFTVVTIGVLLGLNVLASGQKTITPPPEDAPLETVQKWLLDTFPKYSSYKTRSGSVAVSEVSFDGCNLKFKREQKAGTTTSVTEGAKRTVSRFKDDVTLDLQSMRSDTASLVDHLYPDLQTLEIKLGPNDPVKEIILKRSAAAAVRSALITAGRLCGPGT
jgi:hypothetical protein